MRVDGAGTTPADARDSGSHARSEAESGRKPPSPSSKTSRASPLCPTPPPPHSSIWRLRFPARWSSTRPRCSRPRRRVSSDASRSGAPANSRAIRHHVSGVWMSRDASAGRPSPQQPGRLSRSTSTCRRGNGDLGERTDGVDGIQESRFTAIQFGGQTQLDLEAVAQADGDQNALGQEPRRAVENGGRAARPRVEAGRVDHEHRRPAAAQELAPGEMDRLARAAAFGEAGLLEAVQPLEGRHRLGPGEAGHRTFQGRRRRRRAGEGAGARVEPRRQRPEFAHGSSLCAVQRLGEDLAGVTLATRVRKPRWRRRTKGSPSRTS